MKFGRRLEDCLTQCGWEDHYIRYRQLKKLVNILALIGNCDLISEPLQKDVTDEDAKDGIENFDESLKNDENGDLIDGDNGYDSTALNRDRGKNDEKTRLVHRLTSFNMISMCSVCRRWSAFADIVEKEVRHITGFFESTVAKLEVLFVDFASENFISLLEEIKTSKKREEEFPNAAVSLLQPGSQSFETIVLLAAFCNLLSTLRLYVVVNTEGLRKINKKFVKRVIAKNAPYEDCVAGCVRYQLLRQSSVKGKLGAVLTESFVDDDLFSKSSEEVSHDGDYEVMNDVSETPIVSEDDVFNQSQGVANEEEESRKMHIMKSLERFFPVAIDRMKNLESGVRHLEGKLFVECYSCFEVLAAHKASLGRQEELHSKRCSKSRGKLFLKMLRENAFSIAMFSCGGLLLLSSLVVIGLIIGVLVKSDHVIWLMESSRRQVPVLFTVIPHFFIDVSSLIVALVCLGLINLFKDRIIAHQATSRSILRSHRFGSVCGVIGVCCGVAYCFVKASASPDVASKLFLAFIALSWLHILLETRVDRILLLSGKQLHRLRLGIALVVSVYLLCFLVPSSYFSTDVSRVEAFICLQGVDHLSFEPLLNILQVIVLACLGLWVLSFVPLLPKSRIDILLERHRRANVSKSLLSKITEEKFARNPSSDSLDSLDSGFLRKLSSRR